MSVKYLKNIKAALVKSEMFKEAVEMFGPAFSLEAKARVELKYDEIGQLREHPVFARFTHATMLEMMNAQMSDELDRIGCQSVEEAYEKGRVAYETVPDEREERRRAIKIVEDMMQGLGSEDGEFEIDANMVIEDMGHICISGKNKGLQGYVRKWIQMFLLDAVYLRALI